MVPEPVEDLSPPIIGISLPATPDAFSEAIVASIQAEATNWNATVLIEKDDQQPQSINTFILGEVDSVILVAGRSDGWDPILGKAQQSKVPILLLGDEVDISDPDFIACRLVPGASDLRNSLGKPILELAGGKEVLELQTKGQPLPSWRKDLGVTVLARQSAATQIDGRRSALALANAFDGRIGLLLAYSDPVALGAAEALAYSNNGERIPVVSLVGGSQAMAALQEGTLAAVAVPAPDSGARLLGAIQQIRLGKAIDPVLPLKIVLQTVE